MVKLALLGGKPGFTLTLDTYPRTFGEELKELRKVLESENQIKEIDKIIEEAEANLEEQGKL